MTTAVREKFSSQAAPEVLAALRQIAESQGRQQLTTNGRKNTEKPALSRLDWNSLDTLGRINGGWGRNRTGVRGFAGRCMTTLPPSLIRFNVRFPAR